MLNQVQSSLWQVPTHPNRFSPREVVAHLSDWEPILLGRMKAALDDPGCTIQAFDEGQLAIDNRYCDLDEVESLNRFKKQRQETVAWLEQLSSEDLAKHVIHPERGNLTIEQMASMIACHDIYHLDQLREIAESQ